VEFRLAVIGAFCVGLGFLGGRLLAQELDANQRIELRATKYAFSQNEIRLKKGRPVTFILSTPDFPHGFSVPDFGVRTDVIPGRVVSVTFTPERTGRFAFLCDNFCGEGHDRMSGFLVVID